VARRQRLGLEHGEQPHDLGLCRVAPHERGTQPAQVDARRRDGRPVGGQIRKARRIAAQLVRERAGILGVAVVEHREEQPVLRAHVVQQARHGDAAAVGDVLHRQAPEPALGDEARGHLDDLAAALGGGQARPVSPETRFHSILTVPRLLLRPGRPG
jgi:hypothetical protein